MLDARVHNDSNSDNITSNLTSPVTQKTLTFQYRHIAPVTKIPRMTTTITAIGLRFLGLRLWFRG